MTLPDSEALRRVAEAADNGPGPLSKLADREWQDLLERDDRTSPEDYPDMCLINRAEFGGVMSEAYLLARDAAANRISELEARVGVLETKGKTLEAALSVNGYPVSDAHWRNASGEVSIQARALHLAATDFRAALTPQEKV